MSLSEHTPVSTLQNTNRYSTRQLVIMALMCAVAILLSFIEFPLFPAASFLKLDISLVPSAMVALTFGPGPGIIVGFACSIAHAAISGNWVGALMNCIASCTFILPVGLICRNNSKTKRLILGFAASIVCLTVAISFANLVIDPALYGIPFDVVAKLIAPVIVPFNIIKGAVVSLVTVVAYRPIATLLSNNAH